MHGASKGKSIAVVPIDDLRLLKDSEDRLDRADARSLAERRKAGKVAGCDLP